MIDLATAARVDTREFLRKRQPFVIERPGTNPFMEGRSLVFAEGGQTPSLSPDRSLPDAEEHTGADGLLDEIVADSRRDVERYPSSARAHTNLGQALLNQGHLDEAIAEFRSALQIDPALYNATANLARAEVLQGHFEAAEERYVRLRETRPEDPNPLMGLADVAERRGHFDEAVRLWQAAVDLRPEAALPVFNLGMAYLRLGRHTEAIGSLKKATRLEVRSAALYNGLGTAYALAGQRERSLRAFRSALNLAPGMPDAVRGLAGVLIAMGHGAEAIDVLDRYVGTAAGDYEAHELLAWAHVQAQDYRAARRRLFKAIEAVQQSDEAAKHNRARLLNNLGVCYWHLGALDEAHQQFNRSVALKPDAPIPYHNLARFSLDNQRPGEAEAVLEACKARFPADEETRLMLALSWVEQGRHKGAVDELREWTGSKDATATAWAVLGALLTDAVKQPAAALEVLSEARARFPESALVANNLAYAYLMTGAAAQARRVLEDLPGETRPANTSIEVALKATWGLLHLWEGNIQEAERGYRQAVETASRLGMRRLANTARQKMHLEFARAYQRRGGIEAARGEVQQGLAVVTESSYRRHLQVLADELRQTARAVRS